MAELRKWFDFTPQEAMDRDLSFPMAGLVGPLDQQGVECPWPWEPIQLVGQPIGQYHCGYCGEMVMAGMNHPDYRGFDKDYERYMRRMENEA